MPVLVASYMETKGERRSHGLSSIFAKLKVSADSRKQRLEASVLLFSFYVDANDTESWIRERQAALLYDDLGKDEAALVSFLKFVSNLDAEITAYQVTFD